MLADVYNGKIYKMLTVSPSFAFMAFMAYGLDNMEGNLLPSHRIKSPFRFRISI